MKNYKYLVLLFGIIGSFVSINATWWDVTQTAQNQGVTISGSGNLILWMPDNLADSNFMILNKDSFRLKTEPRLFTINNNYFQELDIKIDYQFKLLGRNVFKITLQQYNQSLTIQESFLNARPRFTTDNTKPYFFNKKADSDSGLPLDLRTKLQSLGKQEIAPHLFDTTSPFRTKIIRLIESLQYPNSAWPNKSTAPSRIEMEITNPSIWKRNYTKIDINTDMTDDLPFDTKAKSLVEYCKHYLLPESLRSKNIVTVHIHIIPKEKTHPTYKVQTISHFKRTNEKSLYLPICVDKDLLVQYAEAKKSHNKNIDLKELFKHFYLELINWIMFLNYGFYEEDEKYLQKTDPASYDYYNRKILSRHKKEINNYLMTMFKGFRQANPPSVKLKNMCTEILKMFSLNRYFYKVVEDHTPQLPPYNPNYVQPSAPPLPTY